MITPFMMNSMLHHVGMSWIIRSKKEMYYENFSNHDNVGWFKKVHGTTKTYVLNYMELRLKVLLNRIELIGTISCAL